MGKIKQINIKNRAYNFYDDMINIRDFDSNLLKIDQKSFKNIGIFYPDGWFQWYFRYWLGRGSADDERQINRWKGIASRFKGELVKMIKDAHSRYDDYAILSKIRQILFHWGYELTVVILFFYFCFVKKRFC